VFFCNTLSESTVTRISFAELHQNMVSWFDRVVDDREPLLVIRLCGKGNVIIPAEEEFAGWQETLRVLSSLTNAAPTVWPSFGNARPVVGESTNRWRTTLPMPRELGLSPPDNIIPHPTTVPRL
jgi:PHD/YefM family antitoxin component YafN of YafNO toxin-antitoxin module